MASRLRYVQIPGDEDDEEDYGNVGGRRDFDPHFDYTPKAFDRVPWKSIALAVLLVVLGCLLLLLSFFIFTGHMEGDSSQGYALLVLGILTFLPGFYETRIAYYSWRGAEGYRFAAIPAYLIQVGGEVKKDLCIEKLFRGGRVFLENCNKNVTELLENSLLFFFTV